MGKRVHTGRRRNEAARQAILDAAVRLLAEPGDAPISVDTIAAAAGVGKQTIYRWWPSKGAVLLEAVIERAQNAAPVPDTGYLVDDLKSFLTATFRSAGAPSNRTLLRNSMVEALRDAPAAEALRQFTASRRAALFEILTRALARGEVSPDADLDLVADQVYGVLWYRILIDHEAPTRKAATRLAESLARQLRAAPVS